MTFQYTYDLSNKTASTNVAIGATSSGPDPNGAQIPVEEKITPIRTSSVSPYPSDSHAGSSGAYVGLPYRDIH